ncbi:transposon Ty3-I Gag-Pol polyprotein [Trichonephila clavipes]|nr:transposon Ty3-I Gag-Pol polyprotein [Trichonephila clavipes]
MSKKTSDHERKYTSFELEVLAVVEALKKFRIYVLGTSFRIITDCDALVKTLSKKELNPRIARWALYLQEFIYTIEHRTCSKMSHVDALSRPPHLIDAFSKFTWLYLTRSTDAEEAINRLENQRHVFGNPARIITDKGSAFENYYKSKNILHISITTGLPKSNGQIEKKIPPSLLCCQNFLSTILRNEQRDALRQDAKKQIYKVQDENRRTYNLRRRQAHKYQLHDLVAIKRTQFGPGLKLKQKYLGPYKSYKSQAQ